jgi:cell division septation protein DedD
MATNPDQNEFLEDDEQEELARRSIFSAGWFRALLVLTVLAIVVVVSLPYLLNWLEPTSAPPVRTQAKSSAPAPAPAPAAPVPAPAPPATSPSAPTMIQAPASPPAKAEAPAPAPPAAKPAAPKASPALVPAPPTPGPADRPLGTAQLPAAPAPSAPAAKGAAAGAQTAPASKPEPTAKPAPAAQAAAPKSAPEPKRSPVVEGGSTAGYWVQVGAFLEARNAEALAKQLRGANFPVQVSVVTRGGGPASAPAKSTGGQNQLFITGSTPDAVNAALKGKGTAQAVKGGVAVNPPFDLETAMSLSSSLKKDGFKVVIQRAKAAPAKAGGGSTYHVVRVGGYADRVKAHQVRGELDAKGHPGFLAQGAAR